MIGPELLGTIAGVVAAIAIAGWLQRRGYRWWQD